jgi:hypothetical protein
MKKFVIFLLFPIFCFSQKKKFLTLNNIKDIEKHILFKVFIRLINKNDNAKQAYLLRLFNIKDEISEVNQVKISF